MSFTIVTRQLTRKNESTYKTIFKKCFSETWGSSVPFPEDPIIAALDNRGQVVGFCFVHSETPYPFKYGKGAFMYNLCVDPQFRKQGVATAILSHVAKEYFQCYAHVFVEGNHNLMTQNGWKRIGIWREKYIEYALGFDVPEETALPKPAELNSKNYDPDENIIYLS